MNHSEQSAGPGIAATRRSDGGGVTRLQGTLRPVAWLVLPVLVEQTLALGVGFTDKWLTGNILVGSEYLAAVGLVAYCVGFLPGVFSIPAVAATALVARFVGAGDPGNAKRAAALSLVVGGLMTVAVLVPAALAGRWLLPILGLPKESTDLAGEYLGIVLPALPAIMLIQVGVAILRGAGDMLAGLVAMAVVNLVNVGVSWTLAAGLFGAPRLGWTGIAWGTAAGYLVGACVVVASLLRRAALVRREPLGEEVTFRRLFSIGVPAGVDTFINTVLQFSYLSIVNRMGNIDAAAHAIAITIESTAYLPGSAFQVAAATLAGQFLGAGDPVRARSTVGISAAACIAFMSAVAVGFFSGSEQLAGLFADTGRSDGVAVLAASLVRIVAFAQPFLAMLMVFSGALRGAGRTRLPLAVNAFGLVCVRLPLAMLLAWPSIPLPGGFAALPGCGLGVVGAWYAMAADLAVRGLGMAALFMIATWDRSGPARERRYT